MLSGPSNFHGTPPTDVRGFKDFHLGNYRNLPRYISWIWHSEDRASWYILAGSGCSTLIPLASSQHNNYDIPIAVCIVLDSWWWTKKQSETFRVLFQKWIWENSASRWFYFKRVYLMLIWNLYCLRVRNMFNGPEVEKSFLSTVFMKAT